MRWKLQQNNVLNSVSLCLQPLSSTRAATSWRLDLTSWTTGKPQQRPATALNESFSSSLWRRTTLPWLQTSTSRFNKHQYLKWPHFVLLIIFGGLLRHYLTACVLVFPPPTLEKLPSWVGLQPFNILPNTKGLKLTDCVRSPWLCILTAISLV